MSSLMLRGAYVELDDLLGLRFAGRATPRQRRTVARDPGGLRLSRLRGRGIDFAEVRLYQPGDDVRTIDWRVTARKNKPHTKVFREDRERPTLILVDQSQSLFFGSRARLKSVAAAELAARAGWQALAAGDRVGGLVIGNHDAELRKPRRSARHFSRFLGDVANFNQRLERNGEGRACLERGLERLLQVARGNYRLVLISDFRADERLLKDALLQLARNNQVHALHVYDALEQKLPPPGQYRVTDGQQREQFDAGNRRLRQSFEERFAARVTALEAVCHNACVRFASLATHEPVHLEQLLPS